MKPFSAVRITRTASIRLAAPPAVVFPLFGPLDEQRWEPSWHPTFLYPPSGAAQRDAVFTVEQHDGTPSYWTIVAFDPGDFRIAYVRVHPATHIARIDIGCAAEAAEATRADVTYTFTGLTTPGNVYVETFTEEHYAEWLCSWEAAINHYLRHGCLSSSSSFGPDDLLASGQRHAEPGDNSLFQVYPADTRLHVYVQRHL